MVFCAPLLFILLTALACGHSREPLSKTPADVTVETIVRGLDPPWAVDFAPDGRIFISERPGRIRLVERGRVLVDPWMAVEVAARGEAGLLGLALDPQFSKNRYLYVAYTYRNGAITLRHWLVRLREDSKTAKGVFDRTLKE